MLRLFMFIFGLYSLRNYILLPLKMSQLKQYRFPQNTVLMDAFPFIDFKAYYCWIKVQQILSTGRYIPKVISSIT